MAIEEILNTQQAAHLLGIKEKTLEVWRCTKRYNIPFIKVGRLVRYRKLDLLNWMETRTHSSVEVR